MIIFIIDYSPKDSMPCGLWIGVGVIVIMIIVVDVDGIVVVVFNSEICCRC